jgi:hypothetical protein
MKLSLVAILFFPIICYGQYDNLKLDKAQVYFEKVYSLDSSDAGTVERLLTLNIPRLKDIADFNKTSDIITAKIKDALIDYKKYGGKWGNTAVFLNHPFFGDVSIVWKDKKYRITISNMYFNTAGFGIMKCSDLFTKKRGTELDTSKTMVTAGQYIEKYLSDLFQLNETKKEDW